MRNVQYARFRMAKDSIIRGTPLKHSERIKDGGAMMTTAGSSNIFGQFSENRGVIPARGKKEAAMVEELREEIKLSMPGKSVLCLSHRTTLMHDGSQHGRLTSMHSYKDSCRQ